MWNILQFAVNQLGDGCYRLLNVIQECGWYMSVYEINQTGKQVKPEAWANHTFARVCVCVCYRFARVLMQIITSCIKWFRIIPFIRFSSQAHAHTHTHIPHVFVRPNRRYSDMLAFNRIPTVTMSHLCLEWSAPPVKGAKVKENKQYHVTLTHRSPMSVKRESMMTSIANDRNHVCDVTAEVIVRKSQASR